MMPAKEKVLVAIVAEKSEDKELRGYAAVALGMIGQGTKDVTDAITAAMSRPDAGTLPSVAAHAIALGIIANTVVKLGLVASIGTGTFRTRASLGLVAIGVAGALSFWLL